MASFQPVYILQSDNNLTLFKSLTNYMRYIITIVVYKIIGIDIHVAQLKKNKSNDKTKQK